jgi:predicted Zn finger-like uncharacterized protein
MANLAARCTACGTVFRVVPDQLRVAGGLVRCGRCSEVFNAAESLVDLESGTPARDAQTSRQPAQETAPEVHADPQEAVAPSAPVQPPAVEAGTDFELDLLPDDDAGFEASVYASPIGDHVPDAPTASTAVGAPIAESDFTATRQDGIDGRTTPSTGMDRTPSFVRNADRAQRWRSPRMRAGLAGAAALGLVVLTLQVAHTYRDLLVARFPATRVAMEPVCAALGCRIEAARSIDSLAVESSGLVRVEKSSVYKLQVALRNRAAIEVALPAVDLTLSDAQGKPIARRVLRAAELGVNEATLAAGREMNLQATLQAATEPVAGYTIELFYP